LRSLLSKCSKCGAYTMKVDCQKCGSATVTSHPAKYSPDDKYARYRNPLAYQEKKED
jgi:H/ACA ribonucleoprotein complex subunit 3